MVQERLPAAAMTSWLQSGQQVTDINAMSDLMGVER
jgi:hypothetical protein